MSPPDLSSLRKAIRDLHGCDSDYLDSHQVLERFEGKTVWQGEVHRFRLIGHPEAQEAYAWSHSLDGTAKRRYVAVLRLPPIDTPGDAVRAAVVAEIREKSSGAK